MFGKTESCNTSCLTPILLGILIVLNVFGLFLLTGNSLSLPTSIAVDPIGIKSALLEIEYAKVGGKANYEVMTQAQNISVNDPQNPSNIEAMKKYIAEAKTGTKGGTPPVAPVVSTILTPAEVATILSGASIDGNKSADIIAIEYSDMECPFCIKQYSDTKIESSLKAQYGDKVAFAFKNHRGVNHAGTEAKALGALCAKKVGGDAAYNKFYRAIMDGSSQSGVYPVSGLADIARKLSLDMPKWQNCVDSKSTLALFESETAEAKKYGMGGTPGTLLLNVKTGKYTTVAGAYPFSAFVEKISSIQ